MHFTGFSIEDVETLPIGYKLPIKELFYQYKTMNQSEMSVETAAYLKRDDIVFLKKKDCHQNEDKKLLSSVSTFI